MQDKKTLSESLRKKIEVPILSKLPAYRRKGLLLITLTLTFGIIFIFRFINKSQAQLCSYIQALCLILSTIVLMTARAKKDTKKQYLLIIIILSLMLIKKIAHRILVNSTFVPDNMDPLAMQNITSIAGFLLTVIFIFAILLLSLSILIREQRPVNAMMLSRIGVNIFGLCISSASFILSSVLKDPSSLQKLYTIYILGVNSTLFLGVLISGLQTLHSKKDSAAVPQISDSLKTMTDGTDPTVPPQAPGAAQ